MPRQLKNGTCSCWTAANKQLAGENTQLDIVCSFTGHRYLKLSTSRIKNLRDGKNATSMLVSYCPICGAKLKGVDDA